MEMNDQAQVPTFKFSLTENPFVFNACVSGISMTQSNEENRNVKVRGTKLRFKQLAVIDKKLLVKIKLVFIFNENGSDVIFITNDDKVFGFGDNNYGRLGLGNTGLKKEPTIIDQLCSKSVINVESGLNFMVALTERGEVYTWGSAQNGQLGNGSSNNAIGLPVKLESLQVTYIQVKCTNSWTNLLTQSGVVYWFGYITAFHKCEPKPSYLKELFGNEVINISCGSEHTLFLTVTGKVYSLGRNNDGQLGIRQSNGNVSANLVKLNENTFIKQISCGSLHSLLLSSDGDIYAFGANTCGQLGIKGYVNQNTPTLLIKSVKFKEIYAFGDISMALSQRNLYIWGKADEKTDWPQICDYNSFQDAINTYLCTAVCSKTFTYKPLTYKQLFEEKAINRLNKVMSKAFNNPENSDFKFKIKCKDDFKYIFVHKWFISENSEHFQTMFSKVWSESQSNEVLITDYSFEAYYQFIQCLYTEYIDCEDIEVLIEMLDITNTYLDEDMKYLCALQIKPLISMENVCRLYTSAVLFRSEELEDFCFELMSNNINEIIISKGFDEMNGNYAKRLLTKCLKLSNKVTNSL